MRLLITKKAAKELDKLPGPIARTVVDDLDRLASNPFPPNSKKLSGKENFRLRIGVYRGLYTVGKKTKSITILRVADRKTVYRNL